MSTQPLWQKYYFILICSLILNIVSFEAGLLKGHATSSCDPFRLIRDYTHSPYPNINDLLKRSNANPNHR